MIRTQAWPKHDLCGASGSNATGWLTGCSLSLQSKVVVQPNPEAIAEANASSRACRWTMESWSRARIVPPNCKQCVACPYPEHTCVCYAFASFRIGARGESIWGEVVWKEGRIGTWFSSPPLSMCARGVSTHELVLTTLKKTANAPMPAHKLWLHHRQVLYAAHSLGQTTKPEAAKVRHLFDGKAPAGGRTSATSGMTL